jgi:hypothetical protein
MGRVSQKMYTMLSGERCFANLVSVSYSSNYVVPPSQMQVLLAVSAQVHYQSACKETDTCNLLTRARDDGNKDNGSIMLFAEASDETEQMESK